MRHHYECAVRFDDLDAFGHVNNVTFAEYLQEARVDFAHHRLTGSATSEGSVVVHQAIDYLAPVPFRSEPLVVELHVARIGRSSFDLAYEVRDAETLFARATTVLVAYDLATARPRPLTELERQILGRFTDETS